MSIMIMMTVLIKGVTLSQTRKVGTRREEGKVGCGPTRLLVRTHEGGNPTRRCSEFGTYHNRGHVFGTRVGVGVRATLWTGQRKGVRVP